MADYITVEMIDDLAAGAAFLGTGGGGDPFIGALLCREALERFGPVRLLPLSEVEDDAAIFTAAAMGAPTILIEKLLSLEDADSAVRALERHLGRIATAIIAAEIGGINSTLPIAYAAMRGLPIVDADGMGRAFPSLQMTAFNAAGVACAPIALADEFGNRAIIETDSAQTAEDLARPLVAALGASAALSCYPMSGTEAKRGAVAGSLSAALEIGAAISGRGTRGEPVERLLSALRRHPLYGHAYRLFDGKITGLERDTSRGWVFGTCDLTGLEDERRCSVKFQNENLSVEIDGALHAIVPDLITIVDRETGHAIPTESLRYGQRVAVIGCSAPPQLRTAEAMRIMGPNAFGLAQLYTPIEALAISIDEQRISGGSSRDKGEEK
ncbi:MAG: DUF917 domain-containing protein [Candidatus Sphingomonas phytovorans]|nr:DUF917 domain-containing protein [Sphingomonas sp.]WEK00200.1 MAG: DUF917 domain-containing protein [Sphingomonas sp.]